MQHRARKGGWRRNAGFGGVSHAIRPLTRAVEFVRGSKHCVPSLRFATGTALRALLLALAASPALMIGAASRSASLPAPLMKRRGNGERGLKAAGHGLDRILLHVAHCRDGLEEGFQRAWRVVIANIGALGAVQQAGSALLSKGWSSLASSPSLLAAHISPVSNGQSCNT